MHFNTDYKHTFVENVKIKGRTGKILRGAQLMPTCTPSCLGSELVFCVLYVYFTTIYYNQGRNKAHTHTQRHTKRTCASPILVRRLLQ